MHLRQILFVAALLVAGQLVRTVTAAEPKPIPPAQFDKLQKLIMPTNEESAWSQLPWMMDLHAARKKAAAEDKPLLVWTMSGMPLGTC